MFLLSLIDDFSMLSKVLPEISRENLLQNTKDHLYYIIYYVIYYNCKGGKGVT